MIGREILQRSFIAFLFVVAAGMIVVTLKWSEKEIIPVTDATDYVIFDEGIDIGDRVITFDFDTPRNLVIKGTPRMVTPKAIIDFSGDKVTYSGDLPVDEAAKVFFDAVMGFVKEECKP